MRVNKSQGGDEEMGRSSVHGIPAGSGIGYKKFNRKIDNRGDPVGTLLANLLN